MKLAGALAILSAVLGVPSFILSWVTARGGGGLLLADRILSLVLLGSGLYILYSLGVLARYRYGTDELDGWLAGIAVGLGVTWIVGLFDLPLALSVIVLIAWGAVLIGFGVKLVRFGGARGVQLVRALGVVDIVGGIFAASVVLALLLPLASLAGSVVEALLFFEVSQASPPAAG
ncbi:MAG: hypothetical protein N2320_01565 [Candidatus Bipolaricaulota bacterium]|nr:hypothetical protein [Candidatus Bipolaricaulota bacterium]